MNYDLYTSILIMHDEFRPSDAGVSLAVDFTSPDLPILRERYGLAAIAGDSTSDFDRAVRIMDWLTTHVRHNGMSSPEGRSCALTALEHAFDQRDKSINCAWLALTLTECLLALHIPARTVALMPLAPYDSDNHVVTELWTAEGWVMLDPTCNCYARDAEGRLLGVLGLRAALANQEVIFFNQELRYNGQPFSHEEHRDYLAKDLCWLRMAEISGLAGSRMLTLAPVGVDPRRFELLNAQYFLRLQGDQPKVRAWLKKLEEEGPHIFCSIEDAQKAPKIIC